MTRRKRPIRMRPYPGSSSIVAAGYSANDRVFRARFPRGREYDYLNVPPKVYRGVLDADSKGRFVNLQIKPHYDYEEVVRE